MVDERPWAAPDAPAEERSVPPPPVRPTVPTAADRSVPPLRPRTPTELIDGGFGVLRAQPRKVVLTVAALVVPFDLLAAFSQRSVLAGESFVDVSRSSDPSVFLADSNQSGGDVLTQLVAGLGPSIGLVFVAAALARLIVAAQFGEDVTPGEALAAAGRVAPALLISWLLVHVVELVGFVLLVVPGVLAMGAFAVVAPACAVERIGPLAAMRRSYRLARRRFGAVLGVVLLSALVVGVVETGLGLVPTALAGLLGFENGWWVLGVGSAAISLITTPFVAATTVLLYLDLRVRTEGLDLELQAIDQFGDPA